MKRKLVKLGRSMSYFENAQNIFDARYLETEEYLNCFLSFFQHKNVDKDGNEIISREHQHIIKSNIALMQYNILESSFLELYNNFYVSLQRCKLSLDSLNNQFTYTIYQMIKRASNDKYKDIKDKLFSDDELLSNLSFSNHAMSTCFKLDEEERKFLVNGNLDGKKIKDFLITFGLDVTAIDQIGSLELSSLRVLKDNRQLLAHGGQSFFQVGKESISWDDLVMNQKTIESLFIESKNILTKFCDDLLPIPQPDSLESLNQSPLPSEPAQHCQSSVQ